MERTIIFSAIIFLTFLLKNFLPKMDKIRNIPNLDGKMLTYHVLGLAGIIYIGYTVFKFIGWQIKRYNKKNLARDVLKNRNAPLIHYNLTKLNVSHIISLDVGGLRKGLFAGEFTSVDLISVFGDRC